MSTRKTQNVQTSVPRVTLDRDKGDHKGKVHLSLYGFKEQTVVDIDSIVRAIDVLPDAHLEGLTEIRFDPSRETQRLLSILFNRPHVNRFKAEFILNLRSITLYEISSRELFFHVLYHEMGHHVFFRVIGSKLKKEWVRELYPKSSHVTEYARRNASEDFAESYAFYKLRPEVLREIPEKYWFMKDKVFKDYLPSRHPREYVF